MEDPNIKFSDYLDEVNAENKSGNRLLLASYAPQLMLSLTLEEKMVINETFYQDFQDIVVELNSEFKALDPKELFKVKINAGSVHIELESYVKEQRYISETKETLREWTKEANTKLRPIAHKAQHYLMALAEKDYFEQKGIKREDIPYENIDAFNSRIKMYSLLGYGINTPSYQQMDKQVYESLKPVPFLTTSWNTFDLRMISMTTNFTSVGKK